MSYYVFMNSYGHVKGVRVSEYNSNVKEMLEWADDSYVIEFVVENPERFIFEDASTLVSKKELMIELDDLQTIAFWDDKDEIIKNNINFIESILVE